MHDRNDATLGELERRGALADPFARLCEHFLGADWRSSTACAALAALAGERTQAAHAA